MIWVWCMFCHDCLTDVRIWSNKASACSAVCKSEKWQCLRIKIWLLYFVNVWVLELPWLLSDYQIIDEVWIDRKMTVLHYSKLSTTWILICRYIWANDPNKKVPLTWRTPWTWGRFSWSCGNESCGNRFYFCMFH